MVSLLLLIGGVTLFGKALGLSLRIIAFFISIIFEISVAIFSLMLFGLIGIVCFLILDFVVLKLLLI